MTKSISRKLQEYPRHKNEKRILSAPIEEGNRLDVQGDGSSANCHLVGLQQIRANLKTSYEYSLAIQLAVNHLNEGNGSLVEAVSGLDQTCPITFSASFVDVGISRVTAFKAVDSLTRSFVPTNNNNSTTTATTTTTTTITPPLCAFVGPTTSSLSKSTAIVLGLRGFPQMSQASTSTDLSQKAEYPLFGRTISDDSFMAEAFVLFLHKTMGVRYFFVVVEESPFPTSILRSLRKAIRELGFAPGLSKTDDEVMHMEERLISTEEDLGDAIQALKKSDKRFVIALTGDFDSELNNRLVEAAYKQGLIGEGTHHWWFFETLGRMTNANFPKDSILAKAYNGTSHIYQTTSENAALSGFVKQSRELKRELYRKHDETLPNSLDEWMFTPEVPFLNESDWFTENDDGYQSLFAKFTYDAAILLGLSACREVDERAQTLDGDGDEAPLFLSGVDFFERIKQMNFTGVTGSVILDPETGTRLGNSVKYAIDNFIAFDDDDNDINVTFRSTTTYSYMPGGDGWDNVNPHVFNGGKDLASLGPNPDLPPVADMEFNEVGKLVQGLVLGLLAILLFATMGFVVWTCRNWNSRVVRASQPVSEVCAVHV
jgi:hypothetical protein